MHFSLIEMVGEVVFENICTLTYHQYEGIVRKWSGVYSTLTSLSFFAKTGSFSAFNSSLKNSSVSAAVSGSF